MNDYQDRINKTKEAIISADFILIGGGAGLSDAAGLKFSGKRFTDNFAPFIEKYGFNDLYSSSFYPFETQEEYWAYWAKHISVNRYDIETTELYKDLLNIIKNKEHFVITTNVDFQFIKSGFLPGNIFMVQGDYGYLQCGRSCHDTLYCNESLVKNMIERTESCKIPSDIVPKCPVCKGDMDVNVHKNMYFVRDEKWHKAYKAYGSFVNKSYGKKIVLLELGVGFNTPSIIRYPFEQVTYENKNAKLIRINRDHAGGSHENTDRTISFNEDMNEIINALKE